VVLNRFESGRFGRTVKKVVFARSQFAVSRRYNAECMTAVMAAIDQPDVYPDDMYYFQASKSKRWRNFEYFARIGNHSFYCAR
jgi:spore germination cell wall hydrolase CwlJ-like protein